MIIRFTLFLLIIMGLATLCDTFLDGVKPPPLPIDMPEIDLAKLGDGDEGFIDIPEGTIEKYDGILILMPSISSESARYRKKILIEMLDQQNIPYKEAEAVNLNFAPETDNFVIRRIQVIMNGELPIVILKNKIKANPSLETVLRQYKKEP